MGVQRWGSNGGYQGKNGANIGKWVRDRYEIGPLHHPTHVPPTTLQLNQRAKFGLVTSWLRLLKLLISKGFQVRKEDETAWNAAVSYNLNFAVMGVAPNFSLNYPEVRYCRGGLTAPFDLAAVSVAGAKVKLDWDPFFSTGAGAATDTATFVVYNIDRKLFVILGDAATREEETFTIQLPLSFTGDQVACFLSFYSEDTKESSDSAFIATVTVI